MNQAVCEGIPFPTSTLTMPFFNMFRSKRSRSGSAPAPPDRYSDVDGSEVYDPAQMYRSQSSSVLSRPMAHYGSLQRGGIRARRHPPHGSSFHNSGPEQYAHAPSDESWDQVERPSHRQGQYDRETEYYPEDGDRHSDVSGPGVPVHFISESSRVDSPIPVVRRQGSRMYEQFAVPPAQPSPPPASVTRLDLHDDVSENYEGFDRLRRGPSVHSNGPSSNRHPLASGGHRHTQRRPHQHAFQQNPVHMTPASESSRSDVVQALDNGIPRHPHESSRTEHGPFVRSANPERTYYIVPAGMSVIFRDEFGNELKRVGDFSGTDDPDMYDEAPVQLIDDGRVVYKTGGNYTDDGSDVSDATNRPKVVHLRQFVSNGNGSVSSGSSSPLTISLDGRGHHRRIHLEHSEDGSFGGSQGSERSLSPVHSGHPRPTGPGNHRGQVTFRTIYP